MALAEVQELERDGRLAGYHYLPAIKADLLRRLGRMDEAVTAYREALELTGNVAEREFLACVSPTPAGHRTPPLRDDRWHEAESLARPRLVTQAGRCGYDGTRCRVVQSGGDPALPLVRRLGIDGRVGLLGDGVHEDRRE